MLCTSTLLHFHHTFFFICKKPVDLMDSSRKGPLADTSNSGNLNKTLLAIHYLQMPAATSGLGLLAFNHDASVLPLYYLLWPTWTKLNGLAYHLTKLNKNGRILYFEHKKLLHLQLNLKLHVCGFNNFKCFTLCALYLHTLAFSLCHFLCPQEPSWFDGLLEKESTC